MRLHHVQLSMPPGSEDEGRSFYGAGLGLTEVDKPPELAGRGGCWFRALDDSGEVTAEVHLGADHQFVPGKKAHPAFVLNTVEELEQVGERLQAAGVAVDWSERYTFTGYQRFHCRDPFGNRIEIMA